MAAQPTAQDVQAFLLMTGQTDRQEAILRLKGNNNNVQQAINEYYDDMETGRNSNRYTWDDSQFNRDREGGGDQHGISFAVQGPDDFGSYSHFESAAPSRPPSRTSNNKSPLSKVVDLTADNDSSTAFSQYVDNDDKELQQALAASMADSSLPPQQSGVVGTDKPYFGPAMRTDYGDNWAMVPISTVKEIYVDPEPTDRIRDMINKVPAFLKPTGDSHRLGAVLTICYNIPLVREIFLRRDHVETHYPYEAGWWNGRPIERPIASFQEDPYLVADDRRFGQELQKVMAFLDKTERSYGSPDVITTLPYMQQYGGNDVESEFFMSFNRLLQSTDLSKHLFSAGVLGSDPDPDDTDTEFAIFELQLPSKDSLCENLYDVADEALWSNFPLVLAKSPYLGHLGDMIMFRLKGDKQNDQKGIDVPLVWYPDRYLEFAVKDSLNMRTSKRNLELQIADISRNERQLTWTIHNGKTLLVEDVMKMSLNHDQNELPPGNSNMDNLASDSHTGRSKNADLSQKLKKVMDDVNAKLKRLQDQKEKAKEAWRELSKLYTDPAKSSQRLHRYTLRGVSLTKETTYICTRIEPDLIDMGLSDDERVPPSDGQWWKIDYSSSSPPQITVERTISEKVVEAVKAEIDTAILVYASDEAMEMTAGVTPHPLQAFVRADNIAFREELSSIPFDNPDELQFPPRSPGKRKRDQPPSPSHSAPNGQRNGVAKEASDNESTVTVSASVALQNRLGQSDEVIMGVDPYPEGKTQEMQERSGSGMLQNFTSNSIEKGVANDDMEIEDLESDDTQGEEQDISANNQKDGGASIKRVGFVE
ncbi:hypothetical protein sscle_03g025480 [Sclerotinia sclerotiorum 1980 UF-70]|uniref:UBA domain-containing protein n=1 Tax=Sclerotinia sclerotiorum (strain ATCC 18683 / 1980 / Ss-1) TaxID=665079 RepID=A0A1D9PYI1_SCLS1|nr:hypothetical protein sscle_03g025480 [Sclerotinia sclerotiorum 1980 UF-70]